MSDESLQSVPKVDFTHAVDVMKTREADEALCLGFDDTPVAEAVALPVGVDVGDPTPDGGGAWRSADCPELGDSRGSSPLEVKFVRGGRQVRCGETA